MVEKKNVKLTESQNVIIGGRGVLIATKAGTRKYNKDGKLIDPGEIVAIVKTPNIVCNEGLLLLSAFTIDESAVYDVGLTYAEIGSDNTAPAAGDTTLTTFFKRLVVTAKTRLAYETTFSTFFSAANSTVFIKEAGIWGGSNAAAGEATGLLFAHWLASFDNSGGLYDITINYILTIARG
ncbi:hypothetical protein LCGC14_0535440 [marine sediment metagenome]|uniref:Major tropism determinant N-terminal domain-containing protein n=1 Tax=marine sediment metagenome TaxID=412755 RepID=A0A0F9RUC8_9ZZZZ